MVDVTHYCNDRRTWPEFAFSVFMSVDSCFNDLFFFLSNYDVESEILCEHLYGVLVKRLVDSHHYTHLHHGHDDLADTYLSLLAETCNSDRCCDGDGAFRKQFLYCRLIDSFGLIFLLMTFLLLKSPLVIDIVLSISASSRTVFASVKS